MELANSVMKLAGWVLAALSVASLSLGGWLASRALLFDADVVQVTGTVMGHRTSPQSDGTLVYTPRIAFESGPNERTTIFGQVTTPTPRFTEGQQVLAALPRRRPGQRAHRQLRRQHARSGASASGSAC
jgi:hypothetical protein